MGTKVFTKNTKARDATDLAGLLLIACRLLLLTTKTGEPQPAGTKPHRRYPLTGIFENTSMILPVVGRPKLMAGRNVEKISMFLISGESC